MRDVRQILSGNPHHVRIVVTADRQHHRAAVEASFDPQRGSGLDREGPTAPRLRHVNRRHRLAQLDAQLVGVGYPAVVAQRLQPRRLIVGRHERHPADLEQLGRGEEHHVGREVVQRVDQHALLQHGVVQPVLLRRDGGRQTGRAGPDNDHVTYGHPCTSLPSNPRHCFSRVSVVCIQLRCYSRWRSAAQATGTRPARRCGSPRAPPRVC